MDYYDSKKETKSRLSAKRSSSRNQNKVQAKSALHPMMISSYFNVSGIKRQLIPQQGKSYDHLNNKEESIANSYSSRK